jgi:hypothetical protein
MKVRLALALLSLTVGMFMVARWYRKGGVEGILTFGREAAVEPNGQPAALSESDIRQIVRERDSDDGKIYCVARCGTLGLLSDGRWVAAGDRIAEGYVVQVHRRGVDVVGDDGRLRFDAKRKRDVEILEGQREERRRELRAERRNQRQGVG